MDWVEVFHTNGKCYRYSKERRQSGRPLECQVSNRDGTWFNVRNIDTFDGLWNVADGFPWAHNRFANR